MEDTDQRGLGIENESEWSNGTVHCDGTGPTEKSGPPGKVELFRSDLTDQFSFRPKFPEILVEWIAPTDKGGVDVITSLNVIGLFNCPVTNCPITNYPITNCLITWQAN